MAASSVVCFLAYSLAGRASDRFSLTLDPQEEDEHASEDGSEDVPRRQTLIARTSGMQMVSVPEDSQAAGSPTAAAVAEAAAATPKGGKYGVAPMLPMTPSEPVPAELIGLRLGWISKLEQKTEQVCQVRVCVYLCVSAVVCVTR